MRQACSVLVLGAICMVVMAGAMASPVRRAPNLEARRRSAIDRSLVRFGRSYPPEPPADTETFQRPTRRGDSFLRLGRSQPLSLTTNDLISLLASYNDYEKYPKRAPNFVRLGRDPKFIRLGRSADDEGVGYERSTGLIVNGYPQRKNRARDHFLRLGRDSEEVEAVDDDDERRKRSVDDCSDCH